MRIGSGSKNHYHGAINNKWASSWDYGTFRTPYYSNPHGQPSSGARCLIFCQTLCLLPFFMWANSEGSGRLRGCVGSPEPLLVAYVISTIILWAGSNTDPSTPFLHDNNRWRLSHCESISAASWENMLMPYANNKDTEQSAHLRSLISPFVIRSLDSTIPKKLILKFSRL